MTICSLEGMKCFLLESKKRFYENTKRNIPRDYKISSHAKLEFIEYLLEQIKIAETKEKQSNEKA